MYFLVCSIKKGKELEYLLSSQGCVYMHFESAGGEKVLAEQSFSNWNIRVSKSRKKLVEYIYM